MESQPYPSSTTARIDLSPPPPSGPDNIETQALLQGVEGQRDTPSSNRRDDEDDYNDATTPSESKLISLASKHQADESQSQSFSNSNSNSNSEFLVLTLTQNFQSKEIDQVVVGNGNGNRNRNYYYGNGNGNGNGNGDKKGGDFKFEFEMSNSNGNSEGNISNTNRGTKSDTLANPEVQDPTFSLLNGSIDGVTGLSMDWVDSYDGSGGAEMETKMETEMGISKEKEKEKEKETGVLVVNHREEVEKQAGQAEAWQREGEGNGLVGVDTNNSSSGGTSRSCSAGKRKEREEGDSVEGGGGNEMSVIKDRIPSVNGMEVKAEGTIKGEDVQDSSSLKSLLLGDGVGDVSTIGMGMGMGMGMGTLGMGMGTGVGISMGSGLEGGLSLAARGPSRESLNGSDNPTMVGDPNGLGSSMIDTKGGYSNTEMIKNRGGELNGNGMEHEPREKKRKRDSTTTPSSSSSNPSPNIIHPTSLPSGPPLPPSMIVPPPPPPPTTLHGTNNSSPKLNSLSNFPPVGTGRPSPTPTPSGPNLPPSLPLLPTLTSTPTLPLSHPHHQPPPHHFTQPSSSSSSSTTTPFTPGSSLTSSLNPTPNPSSSTLYPPPSNSNSNSIPNLYPSPNLNNNPSTNPNPNNNNNNPNLPPLPSHSNPDSSPTIIRLNLPIPDPNKPREEKDLWEEEFIGFEELEKIPCFVKNPNHLWKEHGKYAVYEDCDVVREMIRQYLDVPNIRVTHWLNDLGVNNNSYRRFMKKVGPYEGSENGLYEKAYYFFEVRRIQNGIKKNPVRIENEKHWPFGFRREDSNRPPAYWTTRRSVASLP